MVALAPDPHGAVRGSPGSHRDRAALGGVLSGCGSQRWHRAQLGEHVDLVEVDPRLQREFALVAGDQNGLDGEFLPVAGIMPTGLSIGFWLVPSKITSCTTHSPEMSSFLTVNLPSGHAFSHLIA